MPRKNEEPISAILQRWLAEHASSTRATETRIKLAWNDLLGQAVTSRTTSLKFTKDGKLKVKLSSAPLRTDLSYSRTQITNELNRILGEPMVKEIDFI